METARNHLNTGANGASWHPLTLGTLLRTWPAQRAIGRCEFAATEQAHAVDQAPGGVADFFLKVCITIETVVAGRIGLIVTHVTVNQRGATGGNQSHVRQPIGQTPAERFDTRRIAVTDDREKPLKRKADDPVGKRNRFVSSLPKFGRVIAQDSFLLPISGRVGDEGGDLRGEAFQISLDVVFVGVDA